MIIQLSRCSAVKPEKLVAILFGILPTSAGITTLSMPSSIVLKNELL